MLKIKEEIELVIENLQKVHNEITLIYFDVSDVALAEDSKFLKQIKNRIQLQRIAIKEVINGRHN